MFTEAHRVAFDYNQISSNVWVGQIGATVLAPNCNFLWLGPTKRDRCRSTSAHPCAMNNVQQKARGAKAVCDEKKAQFKFGDNKSEFMRLKGVIAGSTGDPVLGPGICLVFHRFTALFAVFFFLYTISSALPTFYEKKSFASVEFQTVSHPLPRANSPNPASLPSAPASWSDRPVVAVQEVKLPDVYMCLPANVVAEFTRDLDGDVRDNEEEACKETVAKCSDIATDNAGLTACATAKAAECEFTMMYGDKVKGVYDAHGVYDDSGATYNDDSGATYGATFQIRSGFGVSSDARPEVPLYAMDSFDLKTYKGVTDPPVADRHVVWGHGGPHYELQRLVEE